MTRPATHVFLELKHRGLNAEEMWGVCLSVLVGVAHLARWPEQVVIDRFSESVRGTYAAMPKG